MFTGLVTDVGEVLSVEERGEGLRQLTIACIFDPATIAIGASICCGGVCMTAVATGTSSGRGTFSVDAAAETLRLTTVGLWKKGTRVNLERSLKMGDELGGHLVSGHVDGLAELIAREDLTDMAKLTLRVRKPIARFIAQKGSVALDGVSLTVNEVNDDTFSVLIIPHTLAVTTLGALKQADSINLEVDVMARYAARLMEAR
ncbi:MAG: riboflavin synthase [Hyphomicrobiales bacterium]|jgi:riboflavin synthase|nr:riboflavin synthase [Hyphomicrobiales bacterium]